MDIRPLAFHEWPALLALYRHLHAHDEPLAPERAEAAWQAMRDTPGLHVLGGYVDGALVCSCVLSVIPNLTRGGRSYGLIENVVTHTGHRNRGLGKRLLAHALALAWSQDCYKVLLSTSRKDPATLGFYRAAGFDADDKQGFVARP